VGFDLRIEFLRQWEDNRRLTVRAAQAFPADRLFTYVPTAALRPFGTMLDEIGRIQLAYMRGLAEDRWAWDPEDPPAPKDAASAIAFVENAQAYTRRVWADISEETLLTARKDPFFFGADKRPYDWLVYCQENEIHHRAQGYIYLRELGVEPPPFWQR
jgi:uncharacterized damage-inducible protein DinB